MAEVTAQLAAEKLAEYLHGERTLDSLVAWSEEQIMEHDFQSISVRDVVARLGVADVRTFGLTWEDCQKLLAQLGYKARVEIVA
jgi:hypothetical protein